MIVIDEERIFKEIQDKNPASVSLNGPDGILPQVQETAIKISKNRITSYNVCYTKLLRNAAIDCTPPVLKISLAPQMSAATIVSGSIFPSEFGGDTTTILLTPAILAGIV